MRVCTVFTTRWQDKWRDDSLAGDNEEDEARSTDKPNQSNRIQCSSTTRLDAHRPLSISGAPHSHESGHLAGGGHAPGPHRRPRYGPAARSCASRPAVHGVAIWPRRPPQKQEELSKNDSTAHVTASRLGVSRSRILQTPLPPSRHSRSTTPPDAHSEHACRNPDTPFALPPLRLLRDPPPSS